MANARTTAAHNPAAEAAALVGDEFTVRVLEPSPPAVTNDTFWADDPAAVGDGDRPTITPTSAGTSSWDDLLADRPELTDFATSRWLGARGQLPPVPQNYPASRNAYHRLAYAVVAEARYAVNAKFGLRYTYGGFGTPFFGADQQVRVEGTELIVQYGNRAQSTALTTLRAAGEFVGVAPGTTAAEHDSPGLGDLDEALAVSAEAGAFLGDWFGLAWAVLEELRVTPGMIDPERTQLWPGHFDPAIAAGNPPNGRATYGLSPGDHAHDEPYLYVSAFGEVDPGDPYWNETNFSGASLPYAEFVDCADPYRAVLDFFRAGYERLND